MITSPLSRTNAATSVDVLPAERYTALTLAKTIHRLIQQHVNGQIWLTSEAGESWELEFRVGRLCWASGGQLRFRRWLRLMRQYCPESLSQDLRLRETDFNAHWEYLALTVYVKRNVLNRALAIQITEAIILEILFDSLYAAPQISSIQIAHRSTAAMENSMVILSPADCLKQVLGQLQQWTSSALGQVSPNLAPYLTNPDALQSRIPPHTLKALRQMLLGRLSLREVALTSQWDLGAMGNVLGGLFAQELLVFRTLSDAKTPYAGDSPGVETAAMAALIICVDDSPQVGYLLEQILRPLGYRVLHVQDATQALGVILRHKPALIFLDITMPVVQGPELCAQLRRVTSMKETPIIMLTSHAGVINRTQAFAVGATEFLAKPMVPERIVAVVQQYAPLVNATAANALVVHGEARERSGGRLERRSVPQARESLPTKK